MQQIEREVASWRDIAAGIATHGGKVQPESAAVLMNVRARDLYMHEVITAWQGSADDSALMAQRDACLEVRTVAAMTCAAGFTFAAGDTRKASAMLDAALAADPDYSLARLLKRAIVNAVPVSVWLSAVADCTPDTIAAGSSDEVRGCAVVEWDPQVAQVLRLDGPAALVSHLGVILNDDFTRPYLAICLTSESEVACTARVDVADGLPTAVQTLAESQNDAQRVVLVSLNGDRDGLAAQADGCGAHLFVADVLAVDMAAGIWSSALCTDETCCPVEGHAFTLVQP